MFLLSILWYVALTPLVAFPVLGTSVVLAAQKQAERGFESDFKVAAVAAAIYLISFLLTQLVQHSAAYRFEGKHMGKLGILAVVATVSFWTGAVVMLHCLGVFK